MNNNLTPQQIKERVLEQIRSRRVSMHSRTFFIMRTIAFIVLIILIGMLSSLLVSYIIFSLSASHHIFLLGFGLRGITTFAALFPWLFFIIDIFCIILAVRLIRMFRLGYQRPLLYFGLGIFILIVLVGVGISATPLHNQVLEYAEHGNVPFIDSYYEDLRKPLTEAGIYRGIITNVTEDTITLRHDDFDHDDDDWQQVITVPQALLQTNPISIGDEVFIGTTNDDDDEHVSAYGVKRFSDD